MDPSFLIQGLYGRTAHIAPPDIFEGMDWRKGGEKPEESPHTVWDMLFHMTWWQDYLLQMLAGQYPPYPQHNRDTFPESSMPKNQEEWNSTLQRFRDGLKEAEREAGKDLEETGFDENGTTRAELIMDLITHNSYHSAQAAQLRRMTGTWPPPSGGQTW
ncbi:DinB family protein [Salibacterium halotolerans]|uniref:DinB family protein n=1 Tax=Salibacterium halotolerans TaxID=1884432 RepID=A0A1I5LJ89_9BACI|nr:DinB family protein [Salibacterium halotolerans]SFO97227.1 DinB family protein [Salibacterium halotolerans]